MQFLIILSLAVSALADGIGHHHGNHHHNQYNAPESAAPTPSYDAPAPAAPAPSYDTPAPSYDTPAHDAVDIRTPSEQAPVYGAPAPAPANPDTYGAPQGAPIYHSAPAATQQYGAPAQEYAAAPAQEYGAPAQEYAAAPQEYAAAPQEYAAAPQEYASAPASTGYDAPVEYEAIGANVAELFDLSKIVAFAPAIMAILGSLVISQLFAPIIGGLFGQNIAGLISGIFSPVTTTKINLINSFLGLFNLALCDISTPNNPQVANGRSSATGFAMDSSNIDVIADMLYRAIDNYSAP
jgi:hypothetical protein